jgi:hypothetical protein
VAPAGATPALTAPRAAASPALVAGARANTANQSFAGYVAAATSVTSVSSSFKVPTLTGCTTGTNQGIGTGVELANTKDFSAAQVFAFCSGASPAYLADIIVNGSEADFAIAINPNDKIVVSISETTTSTTVKVTDTISHASATTTASVGAAMTEATVGDSALFFLGVEGGVPAFGNIAFSKNKVNGAALGALSPTAFDRVNPTTPPTLQIQTGALSGTSAFATAFVHS